MEIALCVLLLIMGFTPVMVASYKANKTEVLANRIIELAPVAHDGSVEYVYTRSYMEAMAPVVEHDINGYFNKENN